MDFKDAAAYVMPLGKHYLKTIDTIAETDDGLKYLDWLAGTELRSARLKEALRIYLTDPSIKKELESLSHG